MKKKQLIFIPGLIISAFLFIADISCLLTRAFSSGSAKISVVSDNKGEYRFLNFKLTPDNTVLNPNLEAIPKFLAFLFKANGNNKVVNGFFEIHVPRRKFPILSINSSQYISLRMPETDSTVLQKDKFIAEKQALFDRIINMVNSGVGEVEVVIDLNRCVLIKNSDPALLKIEGSQVYFRDVNGRYINHSGFYNE